MYSTSGPSAALHGFIWNPGAVDVRTQQGVDEFIELLLKRRMIQG